MSTSQQLHLRAMQIAQKAFHAQQDGNSAKYLQLSKLAFEQEKEAAWLLFYNFDAEPTRSVLFRSAAWLAFHCGKMREAEKMIAAGMMGNPPLEIIGELRSLYREVLNSF